MHAHVGAIGAVVLALMIFLPNKKFPTVLHVSQHAGLVVKPTCVNQFAVKQLLHYQHPRNIFLIVPNVDTCQEYLGSISRRVKCLHEDTLFPNITKAGIANSLEANFPQLKVDEYLRGRTLSGWYLQQVSCS